MVKRVGRLSKLILWEIILLFLLVVIFTYVPSAIETESINELFTTFSGPALTILFVLVITKLFVTVLEPVFKKALEGSTRSTYNVNSTWQLISYIIWIIAFIILTFLLVGSFLSVGISLGIFAILFIIISHRTILNFSGWLHIIFGKTLIKGDLIEIDGIKGRISEITTMNIILEEKSTSLKDSGFTGKIVTIPNYYIFSKPVHVISADESVIWDEINVLLPAKTNYLHAEDLMEDIAKSIAGPVMKKRRSEMTRKHSSEDEVPNLPQTELSLERDGVLINLRYYCRVSERSEIRSAISEAILKEFRKARIDITFRN